jgi:ribonuclease R
MGDKVWIKVVAGNLDKRQLDYEWVVAGELAVDKQQSVPEKKPREKSKKKKAT